MEITDAELDVLLRQADEELGALLTRRKKTGRTAVYVLVASPGVEPGLPEPRLYRPLRVPPPTLAKLG